MPAIHSETADLIDISRTARLVMPDYSWPQADENRIALRETCIAGKLLEHAFQFHSQFFSDSRIHGWTIYPITSPRTNSSHSAHFLQRSSSRLVEPETAAETGANAPDRQGRVARPAH